MSKEEAIKKAIDECIEEGNPLADFLEKHRAEVYNLTLTEYDEEKVMACIKQEGREEGSDATLDLIDKGYSSKEIREMRKSGALFVSEHIPKKEEN